MLPLKNNDHKTRENARRLIARENDYAIFYDRYSDAGEGHFLGFVQRVYEALQGTSELEVQMMALSRNAPGPSHTKPWLKTGRLKRLPESAVMFRVQLESGKYLRLRSLHDIEKSRLSTALGLVNIFEEMVPVPPREAKPIGYGSPKTKLVGLTECSHDAVSCALVSHLEQFLGNVDIKPKRCSCTG